MLVRATKDGRPSRDVTVRNNKATRFDLQDTTVDLVRENNIEMTDAQISEELAKHV